MNPRDQILALLPKISSAERGDIRVALDALGKMDARPAASLAIWDESIMLNAMLRYFQKRALLPASATIEQLKRRESYQHFKKKWLTLIPAIIAMEKQAGLTYHHRIAFASLMVESLAHMLTIRNYFSIGAMLTNIDKLMEALDMSFPGYVETGTLGFVLRSHK